MAGTGAGGGYQRPAVPPGQDMEDQFPISVCIDTFHGTRRRVPSDDARQGGHRVGDPGPARHPQEGARRESQRS